jgi:hypothetical protein
MDGLAGIVAGYPLEVRDERFRAVGNMRPGGPDSGA